MIPLSSLGRLAGSLPVVAFALLLLAPFAAAAEDEIPALPEARGPHGVGLLRFAWTDVARLDEHSEEKEDHRRLMVDIWYPSSAKTLPADRSKWVEWVPFAETMRPLLVEQYGERAARLMQLRVPAIRDARPLSRPRKLPVLLFSHGLRTARFYYTTQAIELASHGYVVVSADHTHDVEGVAFPDGDLVRGRYVTEQEAPAGAGVLPDGHAKRLDAWAVDHLFVLAQLEQLNRGKIRSPLRGRLELRKFAAAGHCFGGIAALLTAIDSKKRCVVIAQNAWPLTERAVREGFGKRRILAMFSQWGTSTEGLLAQGIPADKVLELQRPYLDARRTKMGELMENALEATIEGARHMSFSDIATVTPWMHDPKLAEPRRNDKLELALDLMLAFLQQELMGKKQPQFHEKAELPAGLELRRLEP
jgi:hypothetical protein